MGYLDHPLRGPLFIKCLYLRPAVRYDALVVSDCNFQLLELFFLVCIQSVVRNVASGADALGPAKQLIYFRELGFIEMQRVQQEERRVYGVIIC